MGLIHTTGSRKAVVFWWSPWAAQWDDRGPHAGAAPGFASLFPSPPASPVGGATRGPEAPPTSQARAGP